ELALIVRQEQKPDPDWLYPQANFFQTPVDIEIGTTTNTRIERVLIEPKEEQTFKFSVDSEPLLVGFDYDGTLIKEVTFAKTNDQLLYQLSHDKDVLGRIWALSQLSSRMNDAKSKDVDRAAIRNAIAAATKDEFWGARFEAVAALNGSKDAKDALLAATKDKDARVRARAVTSLAATKDATLADSYAQLLNDQSYGVIRASAIALGQTKSPAAYDALLKLIDQPSWRDQIRGSGLNGLAALGDKRAMELGFKYAVAPNQLGVRSAALTLLGNVGKEDQRTLPTLTAALNEGIERSSFQIVATAANALVLLGDPRGVDVFEAAIKKAGPKSQFAATLTNFEQRLKAKLTPPKPSS
ncbi:MAG TPA: HEAT repeat domain-containing protein, partial [Pyrinomonadaceae bacterium]|nr:HEAT repeat domain-containing protein [Pyrinomonadaceae bacterium]